jgi:hypothetical protein
MNRDLLEQPFAPEQIRQRKGNFGHMLDYVEGHTVIQRLNDALDGNWSFEIKEHQILKEQNEVLVLGRLIAGAVVKTQFGSSAITRAKETGEIVSLADDLKAAATDALKKCATLLGVGLYLYGSGSKPAESAAPGPERKEAASARLSEKQHNYILRLISQSGIDRTDFDRKCVEKYGTVLDHLSKADASQVIAQLAA